MQIDISTTAEIIGAAVTVVGACFTVIKHMVVSSKNKEFKYRQEILVQASDNIEKVRRELDEKIKQLEIELANQKESVSKDLVWLKESYSNEFKNLADKINDMRTQLNEQHGNLVELLGKLVDRS